MLIPQQAVSQAQHRHGRLRMSLAELRSQLAVPSSLGEGHRQRLLELAQRVARVQALGDEYARVGMSDVAAEAVTQLAAVG